MIEVVIKRNGSKEPFSPSKINFWGTWASQTLGNKVDWSSVVLETVSTLPKECGSQFLQERLIKTCLDFDTWSYNRMAGRLYAAMIHKKLYDDKMPTVKELHEKLQTLGLMTTLNFTDEEYCQVDKIINHRQDFKYAHFQLHTSLTKYSISNRVTKENYESPQYMYMRMAMALSEDQPQDRKMSDVANFYNHLSNGRINAPTPNHVNLGTALRGYASCCLYTSGDSAKSLAIGDHIAYTMTYMSSGIGSHHNARSLGDPVRGGAISHQGKLNYYRSTVAATKANMQNGRGGACTEYFNVYDPEFETLIKLKNQMSTEAKKIRGMDYSWGSNKFFARKVARNENVFSFNSFTAPDLYAALYSNDQELFAKLYSEYEANPDFVKNYKNARELAIMANNEWYETGRTYEHHIDEMNTHTPFLETIYSSNLCQEIVEPTKPYYDMMDLYSLEDHGRGEVATCNLGAIVVSAIPADDDNLYAEVAYYTLLMIDKCIHLAHYELPHVGVTSKARMNAAVGIIGLAHLMAKNNKTYTSVEGKQFIHQVAERHFYFLTRASLELGKTLGNAPWMHKTKWPDGWTPMKTYNKNVDSIAEFKCKYDWDELSEDIKANGGIRNSVLVAHMPTESSANASGTTNGLYPIRYLTLIKTDNNRVNYWAAPDGDKLGKKYQLAWDTTAKDQTDLYAIIQKFSDQGISADFYEKLIGGDSRVDSTDMINNYLYRVKMGLKGKYYMNTLTTGAGLDKIDSDDAGYFPEDEENGVCESCTL